jgi:hypothetical protein
MEYQYKPLDLSGNEIRLLHLLPGNHHDPPCVLIKHYRFTRDEVPQYEALSYAWGDPIDLARVAVGQNGEAYLIITANLAKALPCLRKETSARVLWTDVICVNQKDLVERSQQVSLMPTLYSRANKVVVWLGAESHDSNLALDCIEQLGSTVHGDWSTFTLDTSTNDPHWANLIHGLRPSSKPWLALHNFFRRPWFERLWVVQEVRLGSNRVMVQCGARAILWNALSNAALYLHINDHSDDRIVPFTKTTLYRKDLVRLDQLLRYTRSLKCQDPRDKIFALLSLCADVGAEMHADYTKTTLQVYTDVANHYVAQKGDLSFLRDITYPPTIAGLPSWVPDWNSKATSLPLPTQYATSYSRASFVQRSRTELSLRGILIDTVKDVCITGLSIPTCRDQIFAMTGSVMDFASPNGLFEDQICTEESVEKLCRVMHANNYAERYMTAGNRSSDLTRRRAQSEFSHAFRSSRSASAQPLQRTTEAEWTRSPDSRSRLPYTCSGRSILLLESGALGIGPASTAPGDRVSILLGFNTSVILRNIREDKYHAIGEAYVDGCMQAERILGPLPSQVEMLIKEPPKGGRLWMVFRDTCTGEVSFEDPRLGPLPSGWTQSGKGDHNTRSGFVNDSTGECRPYYYDPRCDTKYLNQRGIQLDTLTLV